MSVGDLFKPIWKNSSSAVRLRYLQKIPESSGYINNDPTVIKVLKQLAIFDPEKEINQIALALLTNPKTLKDTILEVPSATQKFALIRQIETNTTARIKDIPAEDVPEFLNFIKDEKLITDLLILHPQHIVLGIERITREQYLVEIIKHLNLTASAESLIDFVVKMIDKISSYDALQLCEQQLNAHLKKLEQNLQQQADVKTIFKLQYLINDINKKIFILPEYQEEIKKRALISEVREFNQQLSEEVLSLESLVNTPVNELDHILLDGKEPASIDKIKNTWEQLKARLVALDTEVVSAKIEEFEEFEKLFSRYQSFFPQWVTHYENSKRFQITFKKLKTLLTKFSQLLPGITPATPPNFTAPEYFCSDMSISLTSDFEKNLTAHQQEWDMIQSEINSFAQDNTPITGSSTGITALLEEYTGKYNNQKSLVQKRLAEIKNLLIKQHNVYLQSKEQLGGIIDVLNNILNDSKPQTADNLSENRDIEHRLTEQVAKLQECWKQVFNHEVFTPEISEQLFNAEQDSFNKILKQIKRNVEEIQHKKQKLHKELIKKLNQELQNKTAHTEQVLSDHKGKDGKKVDKKQIRELYHELQTFEKNLTPHTHELNASLLNEFKTSITKLKTVIDEIEEDFTRLQSINLQKKQKLCEVLESLTDLDDKTKLAFLIRDAEMKWKNMGSVDRNEAESIQNRFKQIITKLSTEYAEKLTELDKKINADISAKTNLITELEAFINGVANNEAGWRDATTYINAQVEKWKEIKILSHEQNLQLNLNFKKQLDRFYERRNEFYKELKSERGHTLEEKRKLVVKAKKLAEENLALITKTKDATNTSPEWFKLRTQLIKLSEEWQKLGTGFPYNENNKLNDEFSERV